MTDPFNGHFFSGFFVHPRPKDAHFYPCASCTFHRCHNSIVSCDSSTLDTLHLSSCIIFNIMLSFCLLLSFLLVQVTSSATLYCTTVQDIYLAMVTVQAGDEIVIAPGVYVADGLAISGSGAHFASYIDGTEQAPIVMRSEDVDNQAVLKGENAGSLSCVRIFGAFWRIQNLVVTNAQKGIVFDNAPFGEVIGCTVSCICRLVAPPRRLLMYP